MIRAGCYIALLLLQGLFCFAQDSQSNPTNKPVEDSVANSQTISATPQDTSGAPNNTAPTATPQSQIRKIHVVVVAVPTFKIDSYNSSVLKDAFEERCDRLKNFFENHLGADNVDVRQYCTAEATTRESLRHLFSIDIPNFSARTVTLVFIMSHGEQVRFGNKFLNSDVELITSDTEETDDKDSDGKRRFTSILVGTELLTWLETAPAGSAILTFLDTCYSGAAGSPASELMQYMAQQDGGLRYLVVSSSLPSAATYQAFFTEDLLDLWDSGTGAPDGCISLDEMPDQIYDRMKTQAPLDNNEGAPKVLVPYHGPLCLGNFGKDRKLLFIYAGPGAADDPYHYVLKQKLIAGDKVIIPDRLLRYAFYPIPLDTGQYSITITRNSQVTGTWDVDLSEASTRFIWLDNSANAAAFGNASERAAVTAQNEGLPSEDVVKLQQRALAVYHVANMTADAQRLENALVKEGQSVQLPQPPPPSASSSLDDAVAIANEYKLMGNFKAAGTVLQRAADSQRADPTHDAVARQAYFAFIAAGDVQSAASVRKNFTLDDDTLKPIEHLEAKGGEAANAARTIGLAESLGASTRVSVDVNSTSMSVAATK